MLKGRLQLDPVLKGLVSKLIESASLSFRWFQIDSTPYTEGEWVTQAVPQEGEEGYNPDVRRRQSFATPGLERRPAFKFSTR